LGGGTVEEWIDVDATTWTAFLSTRPGFVSKQLWLDRETPGRVHAVITWSDEASWKAVPADELAAVDTAMGRWCVPPTCQTFDVAR
jgi:uncharacterized protein (TIGR03792 family)